MPSAEDEDNGFLSRWSDRKLKARGGVESGEPSVETGTDPTVTPEAAADAEDVPVLSDSDMPSLESLDEGSDYSGFLSPGVSEELRRKALSKLFHSAGLNIADGLDDYDEDFTSFLPLGDIITSDMRHKMEEAAKRLLADEEDTAAPAEALDEGEATGDDATPSQPAQGGIDEDRTDGEPA